MGNTFAFSRPRGIQGNYIIKITLDLQNPEVAVVSAQQSSPDLAGGSREQSAQRYIEAVQQTETEEGRQLLIYTVDRIVAGDSITIAINGGKRGPFLRAIYTATMESFAVKQFSVHCTLDTWTRNYHAIVPFDQDALLGQEATTFPNVELRMLVIHHGFQIRQIRGVPARGTLLQHEDMQQLNAMLPTMTTHILQPLLQGGML